MKKSFEEFKKACDEITQVQAEQCRNSRDYATDGVINLEKYVKATPRILWVLKESTAIGQTRSFLKDYNDDDWFVKEGSTVPTLRRMIYVTYGILRPKTSADIKDEEWLNMPWADDKAGFEVLREVAIINIKKVPGEERAIPSEIKKAYKKNKKLLLKQIEVYEPEVVIFGNTADLFDGDLKDWQEAVWEDSYFDNNHRHCYYENENGRLYIDAYHPGVRPSTIEEREYGKDIINRVRKWMKKHGKTAK